MLRNLKTSQLIRFYNATCARQFTTTTTTTTTTDGGVASGGEKPLTMPSMSVDEKTFDPKLHKIVDQVEKLTLLEVSELNQLLKKRLNIPDTPMMTMGSMPTVSTASAETAESDEPVKAVKSSYTVKLTKYDESKKVGLIKEIKGLVAGLNLVQAKKFVESVPQVVKSDLTKEEADKLKAQLESLGATVSLD